MKKLMVASAILLASSIGFAQGSGTGTAGSGTGTDSGSGSGSGTGVNAEHAVPADMTKASKKATKKRSPKQEKMAKPHPSDSTVTPDATATPAH